MTMNLQASILGGTGDPASLSNGHLLQFCASLSGLVALAEQSSGFEAKLECIENSLRALYGDANVLQPTGPPNPVVYKWIYEEGEWVIKCLAGATLQISQKLEDGSTLVILLELGGSMPYEP
jgi:hypothetical protein